MIALRVILSMFKCSFIGGEVFLSSTLAMSSSYFAFSARLVEDGPPSTLESASEDSIIFQCPFQMASFEILHFPTAEAN